MKLSVCVFILTAVLSSANGIYFTLKPRERKCFIDDVPQSIVSFLNNR